MAGHESGFRQVGFLSGFFGFREREGETKAGEKKTYSPVFAR